MTITLDQPSVNGLFGYDSDLGYDDVVVPDDVSALLAWEWRTVRATATDDPAALPTL